MSTAMCWFILVVFLFHSTEAVTKRTIALSVYDDHPCIRECLPGQYMTCEYNFTVEYYYTLTKACYDCPFNKTDCFRPHCIPADGSPRGLLVINRQLPGPAIHVCEGDVVKVNVYNYLEGAEGLTIHWHGIYQQGTPYMDGVGMLTQCPIPAASSFQYRFEASNPGTHFYHAHSGLQRADGLYGSFVVRQSKQREPHLGLYDHDLPEHAVIVNDWLIELSVNRFASHHHAGGDNKPASMLINGKGVFHEFTNSTNHKFFTPREVLKVKTGLRYRFRFISNGILNCPIQVSIDNHTIRVIASDGNPFNYTDVESFNIFAGERYDVVIVADQPVDNYWLRVRGQADCSVKSANQLAILRYEGARDQDPLLPVDYQYSDRAGKRLNPWNKVGTDELIQISEMESLVNNSNGLKEIPDKKFYMAMDFQKIDNLRLNDPDLYPLSAINTKMHIYSPQINHISSKLSPFPLLSQYDDVPQELLCNTDTVKLNCSEEFCECIHHVSVEVNDTVEFIIIDEGQIYNANHPMHLHGHAFRVVGMGKLADSTSLEEIKSLDDQNKLPRNLNNPVYKDTVTVPDGGYVILRLYANNPGIWFFHCHIEFHADLGMGFFVQVGDKTEFPPKPKNFPKCGNWVYTGLEGANEYDKSPNTSISIYFSSLLLFLSVCLPFIFSYLQ